MKKIIARQIAPEYQESPLYMFDEWPEDMAIFGNRHYKTRIPEAVQNVREVLERGELADALDDIERGEGFYYDLYDGDREKAIKDFFPGRDYTPQELDELAQLASEYGYTRSRDNEQTARALTITTGRPWDDGTIGGACQGDWNGIIYAADTWSREDIKRFEMEYFNTGEEWDIEDPETGDAFSMYVYSWNDDDKREEIAAVAGVTPEAVTMFEFDGWTRSPKYKEVS